MPENQSRADGDKHAGRRTDRPNYELVELFFFAYRDFVGAADRVLAEFGFGRAHHRVLHFVARHPDMTIAELLDILKITKQSLNRVLKELIETGFVEQRTGHADRRQRLLSTTPTGRALALRLAALQSRRIEKALAACDGPAGEETVAQFLHAMVEASEQPKVRKRIGRVTILT